LHRTAVLCRTLSCKGGVLDAKPPRDAAAPRPSPGQALTCSRLSINIFEIFLVVAVAGGYVGEAAPFPVF